MTFEEIVDTFIVLHNHFFKHLQLTCFIRTHTHTKKIKPYTSPQCLLQKKKLTLKYISVLQRRVERLGARREDLHEDISMEEWEEACNKVQSRTTKTRLELLQYNWLMQSFLTPQKLNRYNRAQLISVPNVRRKRVHLFIVLGSVPVYSKII